MGSEHHIAAQLRGHIAAFSERYTQVRVMGATLRHCAADGAREDAGPVSEHVLQCVWYDQLFAESELCTAEGHRLKVLSPGWWNHQEGPDFRGAQIEFNGKLHSGDVEVHLDASGWKAHGHHLDSRYDDVILHVILEGASSTSAVQTSEGNRIPTVLLGQFLRDDIRVLADIMLIDDYPYEVAQSYGRCSEYVEQHGVAPLLAFLDLAGEWRVLNKARALRERMDSAGPDQAIYEAFMAACGYGHFKHHFRAVARHLPYDRARQLALHDPMLLETALLQIAGLLPDRLPKGATSARHCASAMPHFGRLRALRRDHLSGLRSLPLTWRRVGVRPNNNPERRLAGAAGFLAHTARAGLVESLDGIWRGDASPLERRRVFEALFPRPLGFWATHCTWTGKKMGRPSAPIGSGRIRSIIGNVLVPAGLALARRERDRRTEERVFEFFAALPKEPDNHIIRVMGVRVFRNAKGLKLNFRRQQGLLQMYQDWCEPNPSCHNCSMLRFLDSPACGAPVQEE